jgi:hypothetical protein
MKRKNKDLKLIHESDANFIIKNENGTIYIKVEDGIVTYSKSPDFKKGDKVYE